MRVAFPIVDTSLTGGLRVTYQYMNALAGRGHEVLGIFGTRPRQDYFCLSPAVVSSLARTTYGDQRDVLRLAVQLGRRIPACDLIVANSWQGMYPAVMGAIHHRVPIVFLVQHDHYLSEARYSGRALGYRTRAMAAIIAANLVPAKRVAVSSWIARQLWRRYRTRAVVVPNGVDVDSFHPNPKPRTGGPPHTRVLVLGRLGPVKGYADAIATMRSLLAQGTSPHMVMVSREQLAVPSDIPHTLVAPSSDEELRAAYWSSDVLLYTSRLEGFGLPPLEAMSCGLPVIATDCGGIRDFATDGENCLLAAPGDTDGLLSGILRLLGDGALRHHLERLHPPGERQADQPRAGEKGRRQAPLPLRLGRCGKA